MVPYLRNVCLEVSPAISFGYRRAHFFSTFDALPLLTPIPQCNNKHIDELRLDIRARQMQPYGESLGQIRSRNMLGPAEALEVPAFRCLLQCYLRLPFGFVALANLMGFANEVA
jgi:hypothetical protein